MGFFPVITTTGKGTLTENAETEDSPTSIDSRNVESKIIPYELPSSVTANYNISRDQSDQPRGNRTEDVRVRLVDAIRRLVIHGVIRVPGDYLLPYSSKYNE